MPQLRSWDADEDSRYFSGQATYSKTITIPESFLKPEFELALDFGEGTAVGAEARRPANGMRAMLESPVREAAQVFINGKAAGVVWKAPYEVEITGMLKSGDNAIRVVVANLAPRKMKFGVSEGMVLAASGDGPGIFLLAPDDGGTAEVRAPQSDAVWQRPSLCVGRRQPDRFEELRPF
jgi:hypothetical protein